MALYFQNQYSDTVWIAFLYEDASCGAVPWRKLGWWQVDSGDKFNAWNTDLRDVNRYAAFYAEGGDGSTWSGSGSMWYRITEARFNQCYEDNTNCNISRDFNPLDFDGYADVVVTLGPKPGQVDVQGSVPLPEQLDFDWNPIVFGGGVPVGGYSHLTIRQDGSYSFSGHFHDSGATEYNMALVWAVEDSNNRAYTFEHIGHVSGTFESGSRDDTWENDGQNDAIAENWASIVARDYASAEANASGDLTSLINSSIGALGTVLGIVAIVVA